MNLLTVGSYKIENKLHTFNIQRINVSLLQEKDWSIEMTGPKQDQKKKKSSRKKIPNLTVPCLAFGTQEEIV